MRGGVAFFAAGSGDAGYWQFCPSPAGAANAGSGLGGAGCPGGASGGADALGAVVLTLTAEGRKVTGRGVATDVVEASARAYLNAVNKIARLRGTAHRNMEVGP